MKFKTNDLKVASVRFYDPNQGILLGYGGSENEVIYPAPKVILYQKDDQLVNLFDPDDQTTVLRRSRYQETGLSLLKGESLPELGICYIEEPYFPLFPLGKAICTLEEIEDKLISSPYFFYNEGKVIDRRMQQLDNALYNKKIRKKDYENEMIYLLSVQQTANKNRKRFDEVIEKFINEARPYQRIKK